MCRASRATRRRYPCVLRCRWVVSWLRSPAAAAALLALWRRVRRAVSTPVRALTGCAAYRGAERRSRFTPCCTAGECVRTRKDTNHRIHPSVSGLEREVPLGVFIYAFYAFGRRFHPKQGVHCISMRTMGIVPSQPCLNNIECFIHCCVWISFNTKMQLCANISARSEFRRAHLWFCARGWIPMRFLRAILTSQHSFSGVLQIIIDLVKIPTFRFSLSRFALKMHNSWMFSLSAWLVDVWCAIDTY